MSQLVAETMLRHHVCTRTVSVMYVGLSQSRIFSQYLSAVNARRFTYQFLGELFRVRHIWYMARYVESC